MRFMIIRHADAATEAGQMPSEAILSAMGAYNQAMIEAGIMRGGEGLRPTIDGTRISVTNGVQTITPGPFPTAIAGFSLIEVATAEDALDWVKRWPEPNVELELRRLFELSDFAVDPAETPDGWRAAEQAFRDGQP
jgi:PhnB protein